MLKKYFWVTLTLQLTIILFAMRLIQRIGYITPEELGNDNTPLIDPKLGTYLIKDADFAAKRVGTKLRAYPVVRNTESGKVPMYSVILMAQDYETTIRMPKES